VISAGLKGAWGGASGSQALALPVGQITPRLGQFAPRNIFRFAEFSDSHISQITSARHKGRFAIVTRRGPSGGGRDCVGAQGRLQGGNP
jgi:hypothetical protein